jgi:hypothetical protein
MTNGERAGPRVEGLVTGDVWARDGRTSAGGVCQLRLTGGARVRSCARKMDAGRGDTASPATLSSLVPAGSDGEAGRGAEKCVSNRQRAQSSGWTGRQLFWV